MRVSNRLTAAVAASLVILASLGGCSSAPVRAIGADQIAPRQAERNLSAGIRAYEEGQYRTAAARLQEALDGGLAFTIDKVTAYKYLAFIHCATQRTQQCRAEFRKALELDPTFTLSKAEAGHPVWGPIYRSVKSEQSATQR
ncbi:MAG: TssQ family T6SS-associated lipoprotein [Betaproteobacteria bacterium]|jgi:Tfp pilus assembly protein PilF|nr:TssQ family T6SS-associated lipoprotein [Betaproteobacteria bacterium]